jgi:hypothetical protein
MAYWHCETNPIPAKAKLPLSRCFALSGEYSLAIRLADDYVRAYSNDWRGWRIIARAAYEMKAYGRACFAAKKGVALGETEAYQPLARSALMTGRLELIPDLIPKLLQLKQQNDPGTPQIIFTLALYSIAKKDKNLFVEAFKGVDVGHLLGKSPLRVPLFIGQSRFRASEVEPLWQEYRRVINE